MSCNALKLREQDNVATALVAINKGDVVAVSCHGSVEKVKAQDDIPFGFKMSISDIDKAAGIVKYGEIIGRASENIKAGALVHIHNVEGTRGRGDIIEGEM